MLATILCCSNLILLAFGKKMKSIALFHAFICLVCNVMDHGDGLTRFHAFTMDCSTWSMSLDIMLYLWCAFNTILHGSIMPTYWAHETWNSRLFWWDHHHHINMILYPFLDINVAIHFMNIYFWFQWSFPPVCAFIWLSNTGLSDQWALCFIGHACIDFHNKKNDYMYSISNIGRGFF